MMHGKVLIVAVALIAICSSQNIDIPAPSISTLPIDLPAGQLPGVNQLSDIVSALLNLVLELVRIVIQLVTDLLTGLLNALLPAPPTSLVDIPDLGQVKGLIKKYENSQEVYYQFKGIPYADVTPRFKVAKKKRPWPGVHDGTVEGNVCPQITGNLFYTAQVSEDCLLLTVTTPVNPNNSSGNVPVLVFFHGGFYAIGSSQASWYDPELYVREGIIVVQVQGRLSALGFVTDGNIIPKNIGLKDLRLSLEWVQENIAYFGGDPNQVTINGESSGAMAVSAIFQSPRTSHLFNQVFMQSGNILSPFAIQKDAEAAFVRTVQATTCAFTLLNSTVEEQVECLSNLPHLELSVAAGYNLIVEDILMANVINGATAALVMEDESDPDAILYEPPLRQLQNEQVPTDKAVLISLMSEEFLTFELAINVLRDKSNADLVPAGMNATYPDAMGKLIKAEYSGLVPDWSLLPVTQYTRYGSDLMFNVPSRYYAEKLVPHMESSKGVYFMEFALCSFIGLLNDGDGRVGHADDLLYAWKVQQITFDSIRKYLYLPWEVRKRQQYVRFVANFVKEGNPTPRPDELLDNLIWPQITDVHNMAYLEFNKELQIKYNPKEEHYGFWIEAYTNPDLSSPSIGM